MRLSRSVHVAASSIISFLRMSNTPLYIYTKLMVFLELWMLQTIQTQIGENSLNECVAQLVLDVVEKLSILKGKKVAVIEYFLSTKLYSRQFVYITLFNSHYNLLSYLLSIHILQLRKLGFRDKIISSRSQNKWVVLELSASPWSLLCPMLSPSVCGDIIFSSRHQSQEFLYGLKTTNKVWIS